MFISHCKRFYHNVTHIQPSAAIMPFTDVIVSCVEYILQQKPCDRIIFCSTMEEVHQQQWPEKFTDGKYITMKYFYWIITCDKL